MADILQGKLLPYEEVIYNPKQRPIDRAVIWLHGLGANGHDFESVVPELGLDGSHGVRFVFPHAPSMPVTVNGGYIMPAWYDIFEMSLDRKIDTAQIEQSAQWVIALIHEQIQKGISAENIVIAGFSQGGAVAFQTLISYAKPLAGVLLLSTYLATKTTAQVTDNIRQIPVQIHHGTQDNVVPEILGQQAKAWFDAQGMTAEYFTFPMAHQVCLPEIKRIGQWLNKIFA